MSVSNFKPDITVKQTTALTVIVTRANTHSNWNKFLMSGLQMTYILFCTILLLYT